jgi:hypothetical protein
MAEHRIVSTLILLTTTYSEKTAIIPTIPEDSQLTLFYHGDYRGGEWEEKVLST